MDTTTATWCVDVIDRATGDALDGWSGVTSWSLPGGSWLQLVMDDGTVNLVQVDPAHAVQFTPDAD